jgi:predicted RNase H-like HicB family nuclease
MVGASHYTYRVTWSEDDGEFVGAVAEFPSLSWLAKTRADVLDGVIGVVRVVLKDVTLTDEQLPVPIAPIVPTAASSWCAPRRRCTGPWRSRPKNTAPRSTC